MQYEQRALLEQEEATAAAQAKLAPWAKKASGTGDSPSRLEEGPSLADIQRLEEEREREARMVREMQARELQVAERQAQAETEEAARRQKNGAMSWARTVNGGAGTGQPQQVKSLAEIQAEEGRQVRPMLDPRYTRYRMLTMQCMSWIHRVLSEA